MKLILGISSWFKTTEDKDMLQKNTLSIKELQDKVVFDFDNILSCLLQGTSNCLYGTSSKNVNPDNKKSNFTNDLKKQKIKLKFWI